MHGTKKLSEKPFLKAHLKNGDVCIMRDTWKVDTATNVVNGTGPRYDFNRKLVYEGPLSVAIDSVAIFETNVKLQNPEAGRLTALSIMAGVDAALSIFCITNPKACFGSCPTFYINENDNFHFADAEGFSNAISPSMEYADLDALNNAAITDSNFCITMKNEALETHCVNDVKLFAYPRGKGQRIFQSPANEFYLCNNIKPLSSASAEEGDITELLRTEDRKERFSFSDEKNLKSKEEIILTFDDTTGVPNPALILNFRQTLMTTYFIYSAMGYMGDAVGDIFAGIETNPSTRKKLKGGIKKELGDIDIFLWNEEEKKWELQNGLYETGPIAFNRQIVPLKKTTKGSTIKIKLLLNKGLWRMDHATIVNIVEQVKPIEISPYKIHNKGKEDEEALQNIKDPGERLISMPGSEYKFSFKLPSAGKDYELFIYSKGYYLEWMRQHWLKDKDLLKLRQMVNNPKKYLREEAANYKKYERDMEQQFWNSKIDTKTFSYYED